MKRYIYMLEVQKPTGTHRILKVCDNIITINNKEVNEKNRSGYQDFYERTELFTYLGEVDKEEWSDLLNYYYCLTRQYDESLEYTRDGYVYLITKKSKEPGIRIGHRLPRRFCKEEVKPIKIYKEKEPEEKISTDCSCISKENEESSFCSDSWFRLFFKKIRELLAFYHGKHTLHYIYFEAFVLTYGKFYSTVKEEQYYFNHYRYHDLPEALDFLATEFVPAEETYKYYVKPTLEGEVFNLPFGEFYSLKTKDSLIELYIKFANAAEQWQIGQLE